MLIVFTSSELIARKLCQRQIDVPYVQEMALPKEKLARTQVCAYAYLQCYNHNLIQKEICEKTITNMFPMGTLAFSLQTYYCKNLQLLLFND